MPPVRRLGYSTRKWTVVQGTLEWPDCYMAYDFEIKSMTEE